MKNIFKGLLFASMLGVVFTSCKDEAEIPDRGAPINPEKEIAATYEGTWTFVKKVDATETTVTYDGKMNVTAGEYAYTANVELDCPQLAVDCPAFADGVKAAANVNKLSSGIINYYNSLNDNAFSYNIDLVDIMDEEHVETIRIVSPFYGKVTPEGAIDFFIQYSYKDEISDFFPIEYTLTYRFNGNKVN